MEATGQRLAEAELLRVEGDVFLRNSDEVQARACYERAIETARIQSARAWELRASMSLAALLGEQGRKAGMRTTCLMVSMVGSARVWNRAI